MNERLLVLLESLEESSMLIEIVSVIVGMLLVWPGCIPGVLVD